MIDKKYDPDESEITKPIDALESDGSAAEGERDPSGTDKLIKIKSTAYPFWWLCSYYFAPFLNKHYQKRHSCY